MDHFCSSVVEVLPYSGCFISCMGAGFTAVELDNAIRFSTLSRMFGFLWHSAKWTCLFSRFLQHTSKIEVLACSLNTNLNYVTTMLQLHLSLSHQVFGCILKDRYYVTLAVLSPGPESLCWIFQQNVHISKIPSWASCSFGLFMLSAWTLYMCTSIHIIALFFCYSLEQ